MARTKKRVIEYIDDQEGATEEIHLPKDPAEDNYDAAVRRYGGGDGVKVKVYRKTDSGKQYCFWGLPSEVDEETIRLFHAKQPYGHEQGIYILQLEVNGEFRNSFTVPIAPQVSTPGANGGMAHGGAGDVLKMIMEQNARLEQRFLQMQNNREHEPINDLADAMLKLSQLQQTQKPELPIDTIMKAIELGKSLEGSGDWKSALAEIVREAMPVLQTVLAQKPAAAVVVSQPEAVKQIEENVVDGESQLKLVIHHLKGKAIAGSDPGLYIDWVIDNRENPLYGQLIRKVVKEPFSAFVQLDPEIGQAPCQAFFTAIYDGLRSAFVEPGPIVVDTKGPGGNVTDIASNAKSGAKRGK